MRRVVGVELVSIDNVMELPEERAVAHSNDEMEEANASEISPIGSPSPVGGEVEHGELPYRREHRRKERP